TKKRPRTIDISEEIDMVGGEMNAFTSKEITGFYIKVASKHLDLALDVLADIFLNSKLEKKEIAREKGVIIEEINMRQDTPMNYVGVLFENLLYGDQPAGWDTIGTKKTVSHFSRNQFLEYLKNHYVAANTIVCLAGQINHQSAIQKVKKYLAKIKKNPLQEKRKVCESQNKAQSLVLNKKTDQCNLCLGVRGYHLFHPDRYALGLLGVILGGGMSSRLFISIREKQGLAYYVHTEAENYTDTGYLVTQAGVDNKKVDRVIKSILAEYRKVKDKKISSSELKKAKEYIKGRTLLNLEESQEMASWLAGQEILTGKILTLKEKFAKIEAVTLGDLQRVAQDIFVPEKLNLAIIGPFKDKRKFDRILVI
ncbi:MAG TPA: insulinase family protein, partial [Candidatus Portnoybacteria bacterium]|nr:insulinase family protein [Candidatus Portnoybacteria bacterium]